MTIDQLYNLLDSITAIQSIDSLQTLILETRIELAQAKEDHNARRYQTLQEVLIVATGQAACIIEAIGKD